MDYDAGILAVPRRLFSQNYVDGGCEGDPPKNTTTDDTLGCYATNYLILVIGVLAACAFVRARERLERAGASGVERGLAAAYAAFFALTGLGYGFAGVLHHRFALAPPGWWAAAYIIVLLGNAGLCGVGALLTRGDAPSTKWKLGVAATALVNVAVCVEIKVLRRVRAESSRLPPRHRRDACSMAWRCRFLTARRNRAPDALVDFHKGTCRAWAPQRALAGAPPARLKLIL